MSAANHGAELKAHFFFFLASRLLEGSFSRAALFSA